MEIAYVIAGQLQRNVLIPAFDQPLIDVPGGDILYAAAGLLIWDKGAGLLARAGEDYPSDWIRGYEKLGLDTRGIHILPAPMDLRNFLAYSDQLVREKSNPLAHFARLSMPFPKILLGYQSGTQAIASLEEMAISSPRPADIPEDYTLAHRVHLCGMEYATITRLISAFREAHVTTLTLDPPSSWMQPTHWSDVSRIVNGLTTFLPSEEDLRMLFWGKTTDLVEMMEAVADQHCELVVVKCGALGQMLYDGVSHKCWQIPAYPVDPLDPTGCGAAFCGGFLAGFHRTSDPLQAVLHGNISASLALEGSGAFHALGAHPGLAQARLDSLQESVRMI